MPKINRNPIYGMFKIVRNLQELDRRGREQLRVRAEKITRHGLPGGPGALYRHRRRPFPRRRRPRRDRGGDAAAGGSAAEPNASALAAAASLAGPRALTLEDLVHGQAGGGDGVFQVTRDEEEALDDLFATLEKLELRDRFFDGSAAVELLVDAMERTASFLESANVHEYIVQADAIRDFVAGVGHAAEQLQSTEDNLNQFDRLLVDMRENMSSIERQNTGMERVALNLDALVEATERVVRAAYVDPGVEDVVENTAFEDASIPALVDAAAYMDSKLTAIAELCAAFPPLRDAAAVRGPRDLLLNCAETLSDRMTASMRSEISNVSDRVASLRETAAPPLILDLQLAQMRKRLWPFHPLLSWLLRHARHVYRDVLTFYVTTARSIYIESYPIFFDNLQLSVTRSVTPARTFHRGLLNVCTNLGREMRLLEDVFHVSIAAEYMRLDPTPPVIAPMAAVTRGSSAGDMLLSLSGGLSPAQQGVQGAAAGGLAPVVIEEFDGTAILGLMIPSLMGHMQGLIHRCAKDMFHVLISIVKITSKLARKFAAQVPLLNDYFQLLIQNSTREFSVAVDREASTLFPTSGHPSLKKCGVLPSTASMVRFMELMERIVKKSDDVRAMVTPAYQKYLVAFTTWVAQFRDKSTKTMLIARIENYHYAEDKLRVLDIASTQTYLDRIDVLYHDALRTLSDVLLRKKKGFPLLTEFLDRVGDVRSDELQMRSIEAASLFGRLTTAYTPAKTEKILVALSRVVRANFTSSSALGALAWSDFVEHTQARFAVLNDVIARCYSSHAPLVLPRISDATAAAAEDAAADGADGKGL